MVQPPKTPPRFVPTLTEVVQVPGAPLVPLAPPSAAVPVARTSVMPQSQAPAVVRQPVVAAPVPPAVPPRPAVLPSALAAGRVPAAVAPGPVIPPRALGAATAPHSPAPAAAMVAAPAAPAMARPLPDGMEEYMVHRVMQRVDVVLDQRLREAIAAVVQEQTRSVLPRLREEIESVVRHAVYEAVADELASGAPMATKG